MIKVAEAISDTNVGGAGVLLFNRLNHTDKRRFKTTVILPKGSSLQPRFRKIGIDTVCIDGGRDSSFDIIGVLSSCLAISRIKPDIINCHASLNTRIAALLMGVPIRIYTRHCVYPIGKPFTYEIVRKAFGALTDLLSAGIIAVADKAKEDLVAMGADGRKIKVIINGSEQIERLDARERKNIRAKLGIKEADTVVSIFARLEKCKDHECFLRAARILSKKGGYKFLIVGSGSLERRLKLLRMKMGLEKEVIFTGFVEDITPYMNVTDINVNCSVGTETSSLALSEGMSLGIPCVASNYGGNPYMVRNGENGFLYRKGDGKDLAVKIATAKANAEKLSRGSRERFERELNAQAMAESTERFYSLMHRHKNPKG